MKTIESKELYALPGNVIHLIEDGVYSLYKVKPKLSEVEYLLITGGSSVEESDKYYLRKDGSVVQAVDIFCANFIEEAVVVTPSTPRTPLVGFETLQDF